MALMYIIKSQFSGEATTVKATLSSWTRPTIRPIARPYIGILKGKIHMDSIKNTQCQVCKETFELNAQQQSFVLPLVEKGQRFIMIECPCCGSSTQYVKTADSVQNQNQDVNYRCPITQCTGWVDFIDTHSPPFWGCGECGSVWYEERNFQKEITEIVTRHPYRAGSYEKINDKWLPASLSSEPANYEELVKKEPPDEHDELVRG